MHLVVCSPTYLFYRLQDWMSLFRRLVLVDWVLRKLGLSDPEAYLLMHFDTRAHERTHTYADTYTRVPSKDNKMHHLCVFYVYL